MEQLTKSHKGNGQDAQRELVERARTLPGVADVIDLYQRLTPYTGVVSHVQQTQVLHNATGGNL
jgi:hypothetical protein